ncbi:RING-H2 finger protein [Melia azedarach]|uniref:RING-H2 finger protein n=1 Tax=Melia azedarach TaxID=155640 RepID=A0ACC1WZW0_MELAZ|nr:RING-H2 finger protein [Melia azedarach]
MDEHHQGFQFSPILIGLLGIIAGSMMIATYHCISLGCCYHRRAQNQQNSRQNTRTNHQQRPTTIRSSAMRLIPVYRYNKEGNEETCSVCLSEFKEGEQIRILPGCLHLFHVPCIDMWLSSHSNCPLCRADAAPPPHLVLSLPDSGGAPPPEFHRVPDFGG